LEAKPGAFVGALAADRISSRFLLVDPNTRNQPTVTEGIARSKHGPPRLAETAVRNHGSDEYVDDFRQTDTPNENGST
jgi:hypothetical protein